MLLLAKWVIFMSWKTYLPLALAANEAWHRAILSLSQKKAHSRRLQFKFLSEDAVIVMILSLVIIKTKRFNKLLTQRNALCSGAAFPPTFFFS